MKTVNRWGFMTLSVSAGAVMALSNMAMATDPVDGTIDISLVEHFGPQGNVNNTKLTFSVPVPAGAAFQVRGIGWNGTYTTNSTSWVSEAVISFADQGSPPAIFLTPGVGQDQGGTNVPLSSNGIVLLGNVNLPNIPILSGTLELEFFDTFEDDPNGPEGQWGPGSTITIQYRIIKGGACPADLNNSGAVDVQDLLILLGAWGNNPGHPADLNNSGAVDVQDLLILLGAWGQCPPSATITGACCFFDSQTCDDLTEKDCNAASGGSYAGDWTECDTWACPTPPDGTTCALALPVTLNTPVRVSTVGNATPTLPLCGSAPDPAAGVAWYTVTGNGTEYTAATCGSGLGSVRIRVYCNTCASLTCIAGEFEDQTGDCGNSFQASASWCAVDGGTYYVVVYGAGTSEGNVLLTVTSSGGPCKSNIDCGQVFPPVCVNPEPSAANCQAPFLTWDNVGNATSDEVLAFQIADDFTPNASGNVTRICWKGIEAATPPWGICPNNAGQGNQFRVRYFADNGGFPAATPLATFTAVPESSRIGFIAGNFGLIDYSLAHASVPVTAGQCYWVEIVQLSGSGTCAFRWLPSQEGNGRSVQTDFNTTYNPGDEIPTATPDRAFCLSIELGDADNCTPQFGACCVDGNCTIETGQDCAALGGCFSLGANCSQVTCATQDYVYDCGTPALAVGFAAGGVVAMYQQFDRLPGQTKITEIHTAFSAGDANGPVTVGQTFGWAIMTDTGTAPGTIIAQGTGTITATPGTAGLSVATMDVDVPASFYIVTWVQGTFVTIMDTVSGPAVPASRVMIAGTTGATFPGSYNPAAPGLAPTAMQSLNAAWNGHWILRANGQ